MKTANKDRYMYALGGVVAVSFFIVIALLIFVEMPATNEKILYMLAGVLGAKFGDVVNYFFGS